MLPVWSVINWPMPSPAWKLETVVPSAPMMRPLRGISFSSSPRVVAAGPDGMAHRAATRTKPSPRTSIFGKWRSSSASATWVISAPSMTTAIAEHGCRRGVRCVQVASGSRGKVAGCDQTAVPYGLDDTGVGEDRQAFVNAGIEREDPCRHVGVGEQIVDNGEWSDGRLAPGDSYRQSSGPRI